MKIVIFDMDGTLIDSKKDITISVNYVRKKNHNLEPVSEEYIVKCINMKNRNLAYLFYNTKEYQDKDKVLFENHYLNQCIKNVYLYDGIKEMLHKLLSKEYRLSVATNAPTKFAVKMLKKLEVSNLFDFIIGADKVKKSKPDPEMLNKILQYYEFNAKTDTAWMVGDNIKDIISAKQANINAIFTTWGFTPNPEYKIFATKPNDILNLTIV